MQVGNTSEVPKEEEDTGTVLPWQAMIGLGTSYTRFRRWGEVFGIATVGFALGAFGPISQTAKIGVLITLVAISVALSWIASKTLAKATQFQHQQLSMMKIKDLGMVGAKSDEVPPVTSETQPEAKES